MFQKWYNRLFKLNKKLEIRYQKFLSKINTNKNSKLICAQVRIGSKRKFVDFDEPFTDVKNTMKYWNFIRKYFIKNNQNFKVFLTTDTKKVEKEAFQYFGKNKLIINEGPSVHLDREKSCTNTDRIFLDFHCLQNCDMAVISESGFGKLGLWNRDEPSSNLVMFSREQKFIIFNNTAELDII